MRAPKSIRRGVSGSQTKPDPKAFVERNNWRGAWAIGRDWTFIVGAAALCARVDAWWAYPPTWLFIGFMQFCLCEALHHEASHYNLFTSQRAHHWLQFLYAFPLFQTLKGFQEEHLSHHARLLKDGDQTKLDYQRYGLMKPKPKLFYIWWIKPLLGYPSYMYLRYGTSFDEPKGRRQLAVFWGLALAAFSFAGALDWLILYWIVPALLVFPTCNYWSEIEEHYNTRAGARSNIHPILNYFTHNEGYHWIHHRYPTIPFYRLPDAHRALAPQGTDVTRGLFDTYRQITRAAQPRWPAHPEHTPGPLREHPAS